jgi:hypothetical protein
MDFAKQSAVVNHHRHRNLLTRPLNTVDFNNTPAILRVCRETRSDCLPMFLANTDFVVDVSLEKNRSGLNSYQTFLLGLRHLGKEHVRLIRSITICSDLPRPSFAPEESSFTPFIAYWDWFIERLLALGVRGQQLRWPGLFMERGR